MFLCVILFSSNHSLLTISLPLPKFRVDRLREIGGERGTSADEEVTRIFQEAVRHDYKPKSEEEWVNENKATMREVGAKPGVISSVMCGLQAVSVAKGPMQFGVQSALVEFVRGSDLRVLQMKRLAIIAMLIAVSIVTIGSQDGF